MLSVLQVKVVFIHVNRRAAHTHIPQNKSVILMTRIDKMVDASPASFGFLVGSGAPEKVTLLHHQDSKHSTLQGHEENAEVKYDICIQTIQIFSFGSFPFRDLFR